MSSLKPLAMTYTEDDLRLVSPAFSSKSVPRQSTSVAVIADSDTLADVSQKRLSFGPTKNDVFNHKPTTSERTRQINEILAEEERSFRESQFQESQRKKEADLRAELKQLEMQRKNLTLSNYKPLTPENPPNSRDSKRFSDTRYYDWTRADFLSHSDEHDCELCRLGKEHDKKEREKRRRKRNRQTKTDHCKFIDDFVNHQRYFD